MSSYQSVRGVTGVRNAADADLFLRLNITLSTKRRAGWHLVQFAVHNGVVKLAGIVPSFYDRQLIANLARHVAGVMCVHDELSVGEPSLRQQTANVDNATHQDESLVQPTAPQTPFGHLPVVSDSLESILARQAASAVPVN